MSVSERCLYLTFMWGSLVIRKRNISKGCQAKFPRKEFNKNLIWQVLIFTFLLSGVYSLGCYLTYNGNHIFRVTLPGTVRGTNVIQQCITEAKTFKKNNKKNLQGIGIRNYGSYYRCYADEEADLRYNKHGPSLNCGSQGLGTQNTNTTSVFLFTGKMCIL